VEIASLAPVASAGQAANAGFASPLLRGALSTIAQHLGLEQSSLEAALAKGASVEELAARQGISSAELQGAVVAHITDARAQAGQPPIESETLTRMVGRALAQGRRTQTPMAAGPVLRRDPLSVYGSAGRVLDEPGQAAISVLA
jgi:hypothetical protein